ncbi:MAG: DUF2282 domain-containing protein [Robiginitomaculum sp.]|nr:DUF2282 domain-containing protein [Robiginitomaculum sp.]MDQ7076527.1 DUF2282 domain-containing protein [Robiginitomaculum sp.]
MNAYTKISVAALSVASIALTAGVANAAKVKGPKEKCYGITLAGENDCGNLAGTHSCQGQSTVSYDAGEWQFVAKGTCHETVVKAEDGTEHKGMLKDEAKAAIKA